VDVVLAGERLSPPLYELCCDLESTELHLDAELASDCVAALDLVSDARRLGRRARYMWKGSIMMLLVVASSVFQACVAAAKAGIKLAAAWLEWRCR
jgi:hypothetical protein